MTKCSSLRITRMMKPQYVSSSSHSFTACIFNCLHEYFPKSRFSHPPLILGKSLPFISYSMMCMSSWTTRHILPTMSVLWFIKLLNYSLLFLNPDELRNKTLSIHPLFYTLLKRTGPAWGENIEKVRKRR